MTMLVRVSLALVLSIFSFGAAADPVVQRIGDAFIANLPADWNATVGSWVYLDTTACFVTPGFSCYGDNPASPYGSPYFGEYGANPNLATLQLGEDEAVVVVFRTPPQMRYYSFVQYLYQEAGSSSQVFSSMSKALNFKQMGTTGSSEPGASPFNSYAAVVWTADQNTFNSVQADLLESGLPLQAVNYLPIPQTIPATVPNGPVYDLHMGHGGSCDILTLLMRTALPGDQANYNAYMQENPYYVVRVGPVTHLEPNPAPVIGYPSDISGIAENSRLQVALNHLVSDIEKNYAGAFSLQELTSDYRLYIGWDCITGTESCTGDNYDSLYSQNSPAVVKVANLQDFVLVAGVNHHKTDKAAYINFSVYDVNKHAGIVSVADPDLTERSALYHAGITDPNDPRVKQYRGLFAYIFSYDCAGKQYCAAIPAPTPANPVGLQPGAPFYVIQRNYMEPHTLVRPSSTEVIPPQVFVGSKQ